MYGQVQIEICGRCNARCRWCPTGQANLAGRHTGAGLMLHNDFGRALDYLLSQKIIKEDALINPYNWGEPFLHPEFEKIVEELNKREMNYLISTNGSVVPRFTKQVSFKNCVSLVFSIPGFSQRSYDKIHQFNFEKIKKNIIETLRIFRGNGFQGVAQFSYHVYQFNQNEMDDAQRFADEHGMKLYPYHAFFNEATMFMDYLTSQMDYEMLKRASADLILHYVEDLRREKPLGYACPQYEHTLTIDENLNVQTCCMLDREAPDAIVGPLFSLSLEEIIRRKKEMPICKKCDGLGVNYIMHNLYLPKRPDSLSGYVPPLQQRLCDESGRPLPGKMVIDRPIPEEEIVGEGSITARGWCLGGDGVERIDAFIDDLFVSRAVYGDLREDVYEAFPVYQNRRAGFHCTLETAMLDKGTHKLSFIAFNKRGEQIECQKVNFYKRPFFGIIYPYLFVLLQKNTICSMLNRV